jgi:hypothetical protein
MGPSGKTEDLFLADSRLQDPLSLSLSPVLGR